MKPLHPCRGCGQSITGRAGWCPTCRARAETLAAQLGSTTGYVLRTYMDPLPEEALLR